MGKQVDPNLATLFRALGDDTRLLILDELRKRNNQSLFELFPQRNPTATDKQVSTLDALSGGGFRLGVGSAGKSRYSKVSNYDLFRVRKAVRHLCRCLTLRRAKSLRQRKLRSG